ncbi:MAG: tRNA pseudouridine(55) synthase TruB, partial [Myxococcota bacterium]|nr:tRNA pseudouridine(55) synthase TruB [Myxococcota bacterium]
MKATPTDCPDGVLVVDKIRGPTSHDVVGLVRRALRVREVGHTGTLDPMATGVLVLALGEGTKLVPWLTAHEKTYLATVTLGIETDTLDADGREVRRSEPSARLREALASFRSSTGPVAAVLREALEREQSRCWQVPPAFSAIRQGGERAYVRARRGEATDLPARAVT